MRPPSSSIDMMTKPPQKASMWISGTMCFPNWVGVRSFDAEAALSVLGSVYRRLGSTSSVAAPLSFQPR